MGEIERVLYLLLYSMAFRTLLLSICFLQYTCIWIRDKKQFFIFSVFVSYRDSDTKINAI